MDGQEEPLRAGPPDGGVRSGSQDEKDALSGQGGAVDEPAPAPSVSTAPLASWRYIALPGIAMMAMIVQTASVIGISITLRPISEDLGIPNYSLQWLLSSASLSFVCTLLFWGRISDIFGHKSMFIFGLFFATAFNLGCALARTSNQFFVFRAMTGTGMAAAIPSAIGFLATNFPPGPAKSRAFAALGAGAPTGNAIGLVIAGLTTEYTALGWRTYFYIITGISAALGISAIWIVPGRILPKREDPQATVDYVGALLGIAGLVCFTFALADGEGAPQGWASAYIIVLLVVGAVLIAAFIAWEWYVENKTTRPPLFRLSLWRKGRFAAFQVIGFLLFAGFQPVIFFCTQYWEVFELRSIGEATVRFLPFSVMGLTWNVVGALVVAYIPAQWFLLFGTIISSISSVLFAVINPIATYWAYQFVSGVLLVTAADIFMLACMLYVSKVASGSEQGQAGSITNTLTQLGGVVGIAIATIVANRVQRTASAEMGIDLPATRNLIATQIPKEALLRGYRAAFWTTFAFMCAAAVLTLVWLRGIGMVGAKRVRRLSVSSRS